VSRPTNINNEMKDYGFDLKLDIALHIKAESYEDAKRILKEKLNCASANLGAFDNGDPILAEATLNDVITPDMLFEVDGEDPMVCECGAIEGEPEWGTVGDGYGGLCPACADKEETGDE